MIFSLNFPLNLSLELQQLTEKPKDIKRYKNEKPLEYQGVSCVRPCISRGLKNQALVMRRLGVRVPYGAPIKALKLIGFQGFFLAQNQTKN